MIEIGAGLGEFIPYIIRTGIKTRPTVIDPANYELMLTMLLYGADEAQTRNLPEKLVARLRTYSERCALIIDRTKVNLINKTLIEAVRDHSELIYSGDVVVDHYGPSHYPESELRAGNFTGSYAGAIRHLQELRQLLCKPGV